MPFFAYKNHLQSSQDFESTTTSTPHPRSYSANHITRLYLLVPLLSDLGEPDKELNPKKKVWEQVQPDLRTDDQCVASYKGAAFEVAGKGVCKAQTMSNSGIK